MALHIEDRCAAFEADQGRSDLFGRQVKLARLFGGDGHTRHGRPTGPVQVDGFNRRQADMHRSVHRRAGAGQNAHHGEWLVGVFGTERSSACAVAEGDSLPQGVAQRLGHFRAHDSLVQTVQRATEGLAFFDDEGLLVPVQKMLEVGGVGAQHRKPFVGITE